MNKVKVIKDLILKLRSLRSAEARLREQLAWARLVNRELDAQRRELEGEAAGRRCPACNTVS